MDSVINFRVNPEDRTKLRIFLLQEGITIQQFFTDFMKETLARQEKKQNKAAAKEVRGA